MYEAETEIVSRFFNLFRSKLAHLSSADAQLEENNLFWYFNVR